MVWAGIAAAPEHGEPAVEDLVDALEEGLAHSQLSRRNRLRAWETRLGRALRRHEEAAAGVGREARMAALREERIEALRQRRLARSEQDDRHCAAGWRRRRMQLTDFARNRCASVRSGAGRRRREDDAPAAAGVRELCARAGPGGRRGGAWRCRHATRRLGDRVRDDPTAGRAAAGTAVGVPAAADGRRLAGPAGVAARRGLRAGCRAGREQAGSPVSRPSTARPAWSAARSGVLRSRRWRSACAVWRATGRRWIAGWPRSPVSCERSSSSTLPPEYCTLSRH